ncbi:hypothetical protein OVA26_02510 [Microbacterium sp. SL62]|uniref:hypothetical protein n=1 Tax=Microbacterium sp. SL62 TaxID=2995139 RepID=UPI002274D4C3|nr:hypothetical protein [Microbacterium sp. SL62]MCY1715817.1 hypothetical protein [Microbacterium sp. SL62]
MIDDEIGTRDEGMVAGPKLAEPSRASSMNACRTTGALRSSWHPMYAESTPCQPAHETGVAKAAVD